MDDLISRQAAIKLLDEQIRQCNKAILSPDISLKDEFAIRVERASLNAYREHLSSLPSVEAPDINVGNMDDCISRKAAIDCLNNVSFDCSMDQEVVEEELLKLPPAHPTISKTENVDGAISRQAAIDAICTEGTRLERNGTVAMVEIKQWCVGVLEALPPAQPERKDAIEKAVAVEAISDELMSRFDISATYAYDVAESAVNRIEVMAKKMYRGEYG